MTVPSLKSSHQHQGRVMSIEGDEQMRSSAVNGAGEWKKGRMKE